MMHPEQFIVFLCQPYGTIKKIRVTKKATVKELSSLFPNEKKCFIFNGMTLHSSQTLNSYGIGNFDHIVALSENQNMENIVNQEKVTWLNATRDQKNFNDKMFISTNCSTRLEAERLKDLKITKLEFKRKSFNKMISRVNEELNDYSIVQKKIPTNLKYSSKISILPLPAFWASTPRESFKILRRSSEPEINVGQPINA